MFNQVGRLQLCPHLRSAQLWQGFAPGEQPLPGIVSRATTTIPWTQPYLSQAWGGIDVDYEKPYAIEFFQDVVLAWLTEYNLDGIRFDYTVGYYIFGRPEIGASALAAWARLRAGSVPDCRAHQQPA